MPTAPCAAAMGKGAGTARCSQAAPVPKDHDVSSAQGSLHMQRRWMDRPYQEVSIF